MLVLESGNKLDLHLIKKKKINFAIRFWDTKRRVLNFHQHGDVSFFFFYFSSDQSIAAQLIRVNEFTWDFFFFQSENFRL